MSKIRLLWKFFYLFLHEYSNKQMVKTKPEGYNQIPAPVIDLQFHYIFPFFQSNIPLRPWKSLDEFLHLYLIKSVGIHGWMNHRFAPRLQPIRATGYLLGPFPAFKLVYHMLQWQVFLLAIQPDTDSQKEAEEQLADNRLRVDASIARIGFLGGFFSSVLKSFRIGFL